ncbi:hypothetical protein Q5H92_03565 [Hymenobacter sp. M29]|uniref:Outer membrane protein beta-barrel domain-containing protein n=1 Tax=Hymenobacter mellowenesis TaxID=3063995 RepID=A0ABT9A9K8_9BACT|nr:hypothetical protein [Hymenobacter sp. M29]MDO7845422.1 hypothetical protein [Hymenobacter sp. M29]
MSKLFVCTALLGLLAARPAVLRAQPAAPRPAPGDTTTRRPVGLRPGYDDVGSGDHLFFMPTARNLRRGEGYAQDLELAVLRADYGLTDHFSLGILASVIPGQGLDNIVALTPKVSVPVAGRLRVGAGSFLVGTRSGVGALTYANTTYGTADHNITLGAGYGATGQRGIFSTPLVMVGGATRLARRVALVNETYFLYDRAFLDLGKVLLVAGVAGVRVAGPRFGGGLGVFYAHGQLEDADYLNGSGSYAYPFGEFTVRFGKLQ